MVLAVPTPNRLHNKEKVMKVIVATITMLLAGLSTTAHAGDTKFYPGTMCQGSIAEPRLVHHHVGSSIVNEVFSVFRPPTYSTTGAAHNSSLESEMTVVCPIVRDVQNVGGAGWTSLIFNSLNTSATRSLTCVAQTFFPNDYSFGSISSNTLGPSTDWTDLPLLTLLVPFDGYMLIHCNIPRRDDGDFPSGIASYRIDE
jgi:hypothetical protein